MRSPGLHRLAIVLFGVLLIGAPWPGEAQQPIGIVASLSLTGRDAPFGYYARESYLPCQRHVNETGGALGPSVLHDDRSDEQTAARLYEKLISEAEVDAVIAGLLPDPKRDHEAPDRDPSRRFCGG